jgi:hypothetical protein
MRMIGSLLEDTASACVLALSEGNERGRRFNPFCFGKAVLGRKF